MTKHLVLSAFVAALVISLVLAVVMPFSTQESPWALMFIALMFPFIWFFAWLITNAFSWWKDTTAPKEPPGK
jgi:Zn-dependent protease with chaperone function